VAALCGCCTSAKCLDSKSSLDRVRVKAGKVSLGVVHNDEVSAPKRDRTDWKVVEVPKPGKLSVQLHWDNGRARLELAVHDVLGALIQQGRPWGAGGLRTLIAVEEAGRYYIRVRARGKRDESHYSLRLMFKPDTPPPRCDRCVAGERKCLGQGSTMVCAAVRAGCNGWQKPVPCGEGTSCSEGACVVAKPVVDPPKDDSKDCRHQCREGQRRCRRGAVQACERSARGCLIWKPQERCARDQACRDGACQARPEPRQAAVKVRIQSMYIKSGRMTLHLDVGDQAKVLAPGQQGMVLEGGSDKPLPNGRVKILKVLGRFAIASTALKELGDNRWVRIDLR
jgi:hypothetical protein